MKRGLLFIVSAPAGTGKTTLVQMLTREFPRVVRAVTCTTRSARPNEIDGQDYFFLTEKEFQKKLEAGDFIEHATVFGMHYGTSKSVVEKELNNGKNVILVIDTQGAIHMKRVINAILIFISPPSLEELKQRLIKRRTEPLDNIEKRLAKAPHELEMISHYDYHIINDDLDIAYRVLKSIVIAEEHRLRR